MKFNGLAYELVRAYQYIYLTGFKVGKNLASLLGGTCTREIVYPHRKIFQTLLESIVVLVCQYCCRHKHGCLFSVCSSLESRPDCNFSLSEAYVAAHETVHRP